MAHATTSSGDSPRSRRGAAPSPTVERSPETQDYPRRSGHQRFVLTDPVAFRYLEEDPSTTVLERRRELHGYECYVVEQWATSRTHPTFVITTYTGDPSHVIVVGVLSVPTDESAWSPRLGVYFKALNQYHARRETTPLGMLMVTNLSSFPSSLTVIPVPDGDLRKHRDDFVVNENLKRLACSGRVALTIGPPAASTIAKFHQLYRTSDKNEAYKSVVELVKLCQSALMLFDKLQIDYADGLLCDVTERAISDWWVEIGGYQYGVEPHDGILGPTTVAALLGLLMGARNRLHAVSAPVAKDVFDVDATKRGISHFQKQQRIPRTRRLDRRTLDRLHKASAKAATSEGWIMPRAVKSTVAELSGKGGEMVMDVVGRRDRAGIAEIETTEFERFVQLVYGERCKWLWYGKPLKKSKDIGDSSFGNETLTFESDEHGGFTWTGRRSTGDIIPSPLTMTKIPEHPHAAAQDTDNTDDEESKSKLRKRATDLKNEARSGLGKIRGAVSLKGNQQRHTPDESPSTPPRDPARHSRRPIFSSAPTSPLSSPTSATSPLDDQEFSLSPQEISTPPRQNQHREGLTHHAQSGDRYPKVIVSPDEPSHSRQQTRQALPQLQELNGARHKHVPASIAGSIYEGVDLTEALPEDPQTGHDVSNLLRRTLSYNQYVSAQQETREPEYYPRHLSFSLAEDSVLNWDDVAHDERFEDFDQPLAMLADEVYAADEAKQLRLAINELRVEAVDWTKTQLYSLRTLVDQAEQDQHTLDSAYYSRKQSVQTMHTNTDEIIQTEKEAFEEGSKELETLVARLNYEIDGLRGRIEDVEHVVDDFAKGVERVEDRVSELEEQGERKPGWRCVVS